MAITSIQQQICANLVQVSAILVMDQVKINVITARLEIFSYSEPNGVLLPVLQVNMEMS